MITNEKLIGLGPVKLKYTVEPVYLFLALCGLEKIQIKFNQILVQSLHYEKSTVEKNN